MFRRLPRDNFPDDTESAAFQNYRSGQTARQWRIPFNWRNWVLYGVLGLLIILLSFGIFVLYEQFAVGPSATPTPNPTPTPIPIIIEGIFPPQVPQTFITTPARIDDSYIEPNSRGYTFHMNPGKQWAFILSTDGNWTAQIDLYGEGGQILATATTSGNQPATITYFVSQEDIYAIHLQSSDGLSGGYTLEVMPTDLQ